jgi:hypothetical protein
MRVGRHIRFLVIASPWIGTLRGQPYSVERLARYINRRRLPAYIFTRPPETGDHQDAIRTLLDCPSAELVYNQNLHAKIYACVGPQPYGFAILGSANLTMHSAELYEIGLLVLTGGGGDHVVRELADFGLNFLRTRPDSTVIKKRKPGRFVDDL